LKKAESEVYYILAIPFYNATFNLNFNNNDNNDNNRNNNIDAKNELGFPSYDINKNLVFLFFLFFNNNIIAYC
jgi:hypothetical protein